MSKIYLVSKGSYSDYCILGVYSTEALAARAAELYSDHWDEAEVKDYELDAMPECPLGMRGYKVQMDRDGDGPAPRRASLPFDFLWEPYATDSVFVVFMVVATDETHAVKIANERRTQLIASGEWTTDWKEWTRRNAGK